MSLHYLNGLGGKRFLKKSNAFKQGITEILKPEFNTPGTMNDYDVLVYPKNDKIGAQRPTKTTRRCNCATGKIEEHVQYTDAQGGGYTIGTGESCNCGGAKVVSKPLTTATRIGAQRPTKTTRRCNCATGMIEEHVQYTDAQGGGYTIGTGENCNCGSSIKIDRFNPKNRAIIKQVAVNGWGDFSDAWDSVTSAVDSAVDSISSGFQNVVTTVQAAGSNAVKSITDQLNDAFNNVSGLANNFKTAISNKWAELTPYIDKYGKKIALQPIRTAFLICVSANFLRLGTHLANAWNKDFTKLNNWWVNDWGGRTDRLKEAIQRSSKVTLNGTRIGEPITAATVTAAAAEASAAIASVTALLKQLGIDTDQLWNDIKSKVKPNSNAKQVDATSPDTETLPPVTTYSKDVIETTPTPTKDNTMLYVGGAALLGGAIYLMNKKRK